MGNPWSEEEKIIKNKKNIFRQKKEQVDTTIKDMRNLCRLKKEVNRVNNIVLRNIKNLSEREKEEENYYKPVRVDNFRRNNYTIVMVIKMKYYQLKNILIKFDHIYKTSKAILKNLAHGKFN